MSGTTLKWIAVISMLIDHTAEVLINHNAALTDPIWAQIYVLMRGIGRIAFPIYAFLLVRRGGGGKAFPPQKGKNFYEIITTDKLVVCTAPKRGHYRHSPCKGAPNYSIASHALPPVNGYG